MGLSYLIQIILDGSHGDVVKESMEFYVKLQLRLNPTVERMHGSAALRTTFIQVCLVR